MKEKNIKILTDNGVDVEKSLELFGDINTYNDTLGELLNAIEKKIPQLEQYKQLGDMVNYAVLVHSLKSDARYFGFTELGEIAYSHELKSKDNNLSFVNMHFDELKQIAEKTRNLIKSYLGNKNVDNSNNENPISNHPEPVQQTVEKLNEKTFLVADDSNIVRNFVKRTFHDKGVCVVEDGSKVIDMIKENEEMIIGMLLDLNMPNVDGFKVLDYFKENDLFKKIPVSIITGESAKETINKVYEYNIVDVLTKPFSENELKRVVDKTVNIMSWN